MNWLARCESGLRRLLGGLSWIAVLLVLCVLVSVVLDASGSQANTAASELSWWLYALLFLFGFSLTLLDDRHVRVDVLAQRWSPRSRRIIEVIGTLVLLLPLVGIILVKGIDYTAQAWRIDQGSGNPGGLPNYWLIKAAIPLAMLVLAASAVLRLLQTLAGRPVGDGEPPAGAAAPATADDGAAVEPPVDAEGLGR